MSAQGRWIITVVVLLGIGILLAPRPTLAAPDTKLVGPAVSEQVRLFALPASQATAEELYRRGAARFSAGDLDGAIEDFTETLRLDPTHAAAYTNRGLARSDLGDQQGAIADATEALRLAPNNAVAYTNLGLAYLRLREPAEAIEY